MWSNFDFDKLTISSLQSKLKFCRGACIGRIDGALGVFAMGPYSISLQASCISGDSLMPRESASGVRYPSSA